MSVIENLSHTEKLRMIESLWDDLAHDTSHLPTPSWHGSKRRVRSTHHGAHCGCALQFLDDLVRSTHHGAHSVTGDWD